MRNLFLFIWALLCVSSWGCQDEVLRHADALYARVNWRGKPLEKQEFQVLYYVADKKAWIRQTLLERGSSLEILEDPIGHLSRVYGVQGTSREGVWIKVGELPPQLFSARVTAEEADLTARAIRELPHPEHGYIKVWFADGTCCRRRISGNSLLIALSPTHLSGCHERVLAQRIKGNGIVRIDLVHTHAVPPVLFRRANGEIFEGVALLGGADLQGPHFIRKWLAGRVVGFVEGEAIDMNVRDARRLGVSQADLSAISQLREWRALDVPIRISAIVGVERESLFKVSYEN